MPCGSRRAFILKLQSLKSTPFFVYVQEEDFGMLARSFTAHRFSKGQVMPESPFYLVVRGELDIVLKGTPDILCIKHQGAFFSRNAGIVEVRLRPHCFVHTRTPCRASTHAAHTPTCNPSLPSQISWHPITTDARGVRSQVTAKPNIVAASFRRSEELASNTMRHLKRLTSLSGDGVFAGQRSDKVDSGRRTHQSDKRWTSGKDLLGVAQTASRPSSDNKDKDAHTAARSPGAISFALALADNKPTGDSPSSDKASVFGPFLASSPKVPSLMASPSDGPPQTTFISSKVLWSK